MKLTLMGAFLFGAILLFNLPSFSEELNEKLDRLNRQHQADCNKSQPDCASISNQFCSKIWNEKDPGNYPAAGIHIGLSNKSRLTEIEKIDLIALGNSVPNLPSDLKSILSADINTLKNVVARETDDLRWYTALSIVRGNIQSSIDHLAHSRADVKIAAIEKQQSRHLNGDEKNFFFMQERGAILDSVTAAKYKENPNWKRVEKVFSQVKAEMIKDLDSLLLSNEEKKIRIKKIRSVNLVLPPNLESAGVARFAVKSNCATNSTNAFYSESKNIFTVCAGLFNGYQNEDALYTVIAHELAHSINVARLENSQLSSMFPEGDLIIAKNGNMDCGQWAAYRKKMSARAATKTCANKSREMAYASCLMANENQYTAEIYVDDTLNKNVSLRNKLIKDLSKTTKDKLFCQLFDPKQKEYYLNPQRFIQANIRKISSSRSGESWNSPISQKDLDQAGFFYVLTQAVRCEGNKFNPCVKDSNASQNLVDLFVGASACLDTVDSSAENESDWFASRLMNRRLNKELPAERRESAVQSLALFCEKPTTKGEIIKEIPVALLILAVNPDLILSDNHANTKDRRLNIFDSFTENLQCKPKTGKYDNIIRKCML